MKYCTNCNKEIDSNERFCSVCGGKLIDRESNTPQHSPFDVTVRAEPSPYIEQTPQPMNSFGTPTPVYVTSSAPRKNPWITAAVVACVCLVALASLKYVGVFDSFQQNRERAVPEFSNDTVSESQPSPDTSNSEPTAADNKVTVPGVENLSVDNAKALIKDAGLNYEINVQDSSEPENTVIAQSPSKGDKLEKGDTVTIVVAKAYEVKEDSNSNAQEEDNSNSNVQSQEPQPDPNTVYIRDYTNENANSVAEELRSQGITVSCNYEASLTYWENIIMSQSVAPGTYLNKNDKIVLTVSMGKFPVYTTHQPTSANSKFSFFNKVSSSSHLASEGSYTYIADNVLRDDGTCWCEGVSGVGIGQYIEFSNDEPSPVSSVGIKIGYTVDTERFLKNGKPTTITIQGDDPKDKFVFYMQPNNMDEQICDFGKNIYTRNLKIIISNAEAGTEYDDTCISLIVPYE